MAKEDKVVYGDNRCRSAGFEALWQLARQTVEQGHVVLCKVVDHACRPPPRPRQLVPQAVVEQIMRINKFHVLALCNLPAQFRVAARGCKEQQPRFCGSSKVVDQGAAVAPQSRVVAHNALCIEAYYRVAVNH